MNTLLLKIDFRSFDDILKKFKENFVSFPKNFTEGVNELIKNPLAIAILLVLLVAIIILFKSGKTKFTASLIAKIALTVAISVVLNNITFLKMPQGGSVTLVSMLPIFLIALAYGPRVGFIAGFIFGIVNFFMGPYIVHPIQVLFDYPLPYMFLGTAGYFKKHFNLGIIIATLLRFMCHFISGLVFFGDYAKGTGMSPTVYSLVYNAQYVGVELILVLIIANLLPMNRLVKAINPNAETVSR